MKVFPANLSSTVGLYVLLSEDIHVFQSILQFETIPSWGGSWCILVTCRTRSVYARVERGHVEAVRLGRGRYSGRAKRRRVPVNRRIGVRRICSESNSVLKEKKVSSPFRLMNCFGNKNNGENRNELIEARLKWQWLFFGQVPAVALVYTGNAGLSELSNKTINNRINHHNFVLFFWIF